ncbi:hypothetical protein CJF31_00003267 [Rutstroemia sp. NJR-2017a BVV2]|nr:hypothetical protein CJF31_00002059 [Rutstroemia sp. NJR-2017a BVV2]PQE18582.1 hypothetical protein CJF31_00003267 [Rutstroemia sp. NJR-2017a BVV2]
MHATRSLPIYNLVAREMRLGPFQRCRTSLGLRRPNQQRLFWHTAKMSADDDYGFSSGDEADLLNMVNEAEAAASSQGIAGTQSQEVPQSHKRKASSEIVSQLSKKLATEEPPRIFESAVSALKRHFGLNSFRLKQEQAISWILHGQNAAVVFPTGGGKSLCFQVPALAFEEEDRRLGARDKKAHGITLVVSPLIALMKDQVDALTRRGIAAATFDSTKTREEYLQTVDAMRNGELKLLYCAPERLNNEGFVEQMKHVRGGIRLLAVDEAHCISEWGHSFRPDYLIEIARFADEIQAERVVCLTATATPRVAQDICDAFKINNDGLFRTTTYRSNLRLLAESGKTKEELFPNLCAFLRKNTGSTIVYVTLQKDTEKLAAKLRQEGFTARAFHAGMDTATKTKLQDTFMRSDSMIMVATIAFGMGIDKDSIRNVVHFSIPSSLESYSQEIGRSGRDGKPANCIFYVCGEDLHLRELFARGGLPSRTSVHNLLNDIFDSTHSRLPIGSQIKTSHYNQQIEFDIRATTLSNIYAQLELTHGLIRATTPMYQKYSYTVNETKYKAKLSSDTSPAANAIKLHAKKASKLHHIDIEEAAMIHKIERKDIVGKLNEWNDEQIVDLRASGVINTYKVLQKLPQKPAEIEKLADVLHKTMTERETAALQRTEQMLQLITGSKCFSKALAQHFGDDLPDGKKECGHCQWCMTHKPIQVQLPPPVPFNKLAFKQVLEKIQERDDPRFLARVAFGISSPKVTTMKLSRDAIFASMEDHEFMDLLKAFEKACKKKK